MALNSFKNPRMLCPKIGWNMLDGSAEEDSQKLLMYEYLLCSLKEIWIPYPWMLCDSLVEIDPVVLEKNILKCNQLFFKIFLDTHPSMYIFVMICCLFSNCGKNSTTRLQSLYVTFYLRCKCASFLCARTPRNALGCSIEIWLL